MSADYWLENDDCCEHHSVNVTYNLGPMLREAGFPSWDALVGAPASETAGMLSNVARRLRAEPHRFRSFNPPNGWGNYEWALEFVEDFAKMCREHPRATIGAWL